MPIVITPYNPRHEETTVEAEHLGRVVRIRNYEAQRNFSDTLDYSDFRTAQIVEALVYRGRMGQKSIWYNDPGARLVDISLAERFIWVDCTNIFVWRGSEHRFPVVDEECSWPEGMKEDLAAWDRIQGYKEHCAAVERLENERKRLWRAEVGERDAVVKGKRMIVASGRKVPRGIQGTVAFVGEGKALLKADSEWNDRKANGVWVQNQHLVAFGPCGYREHTDCASLPELAKACAEAHFHFVDADEEVNIVVPKPLLKGGKTG